MSPSPYAGARIALATRHGKERVIGRALRHGLGAGLLHVREIDTDQLGSFCGTVARRGSAREACLAKAQLALRHGGTGLAIASEGSFGPHPAVPFLPAGLECLVFLDAERGLTIQEELLARRTNYAQRSFAAAAAGEGSLPEDLRPWLRQVGFPSHALIVRPHRDGPGAMAAANAGETGAAAGLSSGIQGLPELLAAIQRAAAASSDGRVRLETDMRAHLNPTRMASIRQLSFRLVRRLASACPSCGSPGWGLVGSEPGLPCGWCGLPTALVRLERHGCPACGHTREKPRADGLTRADPGQCLHCNP